MFKIVRFKNPYTPSLPPWGMGLSPSLSRFKSLAKPWIWNSARSIISTFFEGPDFKTTKWGRNRKWKWRLRHRMPSSPDGNATYRGDLTDCMRNNTASIVKWKLCLCMFDSLLKFASSQSVSKWRVFWSEINQGGVARVMPSCSISKPCSYHHSSTPQWEWGWEPRRRLHGAI